MKHTNYIYRFITISAFILCFASQFVLADTLTQQERTLISDFTSGITTFQIRTTFQHGGPNIVKPILPNVPSNVAAAIEKAIDCKDKEALANVTALVLKFARFANSPLFSEKVILSWNNPLTKAYYRIQQLSCGRVVEVPETAKITTESIYYNPYSEREWLGTHPQLDNVIQPFLDADCIRHRVETEAELTRLMNKFPCSDSFTVPEAKQMIKDYVTCE